MGLFGKKRKAVEERNFFPYLTQAYGGGVFRAELNPAVDTAVSKISSTISILPVKLYTYTKNGKKEAYWDNVSKLLKDPCVEESAELFWKTMIRHLLLTGNTYIFKHKYKGEITSLEIIDPTLVTVTRNEYGLKLYNIAGQRGGTYTDREVLHIPYIEEGYQGTLGVSPTSVHKDLIMRNNVINEYIKVFFHNGIGSRLLVTLNEKYEPGSPKMEKLMQEFKAYFNTFILGPENAGQPIVSVPGTTVSKIEQSNNVQAEVLKLKEQSDCEIYRMFNIPEAVLIPSLNKYNSLEQANADFLNSCIKPLTQHIGQMFIKGLVAPEYQRTMFIEFDFSGLLETNPNKILDYYKNAFHSGIMTLGEVRDALNLSEVEDDLVANTYLIPSNLIPYDRDTIEAAMARSKLALKQMEEGETIQEETPSEAGKVNKSAEKQEELDLNHNGTQMDKNV